MANSVDRDRMELEGVIIDSNKGVFRVQINEGHIVIARLSGKMKLNDIKCILNDQVVVEVSPFDTSNGRIIKRYK